MTLEERVADLEKRVAGIERVTNRFIPLGPGIDHEQLDRDRHETVKRITEHLTRELGWYCDNCKNVHGPAVQTCPQPAKGGSLRERLGQVSNG